MDSEKNSKVTTLKSNLSSSGYDSNEVILQESDVSANNKTMKRKRIQNKSSQSKTTPGKNCIKICDKANSAEGTVANNNSSNQGNKKSDSLSNSSQLKIKISKYQSKKGRSLGIVAESEGSGLLDRQNENLSMPDGICMKSPESCTKKQRRTQRAGGKKTKENVSVVDLDLLTNDAVDLPSHSISTSGLQFYRYNEQACRAPHMCNICSVNDHTYSKDSDHRPELSSSSAGCIHTVSCQHYRNRGNTLLERDNKSNCEKKINGSCLNLRWSIVPRSVSSIKSLQTYVPISSALYQAYRNIAQQSSQSHPSFSNLGRDEKCGCNSADSKFEDNLFCNEVMWDSDSEWLKVEDIDSHGQKVLTKRIRPACNGENHSSYVCGILQNNTGPCFGIERSKNKMFSNGSQSLGVDDSQNSDVKTEANVEIASYGAEVTIEEVSEMSKTERRCLVNKKLKFMMLKSKIAQLERSSVSAKVHEYCDDKANKSLDNFKNSGVEIVENENEAVVKTENEAEIVKTENDIVKHISLETDKDIIGSMELYQMLLNTSKKSTSVNKQSSKINSSCSIEVNHVSDTLCKVNDKGKEPCSKELQMCESSQNSSLEKRSTEPVAGRVDGKDKSESSYLSMLDTNDLLAVSNHSHSVLDLSAFSNSSKAGTCSEFNTSYIDINAALDLCIRIKQPFTSMINTVGENVSLTTTENCLGKTSNSPNRFDVGVDLTINGKSVQPSVEIANDDAANDDAALSLKLLCNDLSSVCRTKSNTNVLRNSSTCPTNDPKDLGFTVNGQPFQGYGGPVEIASDDAALSLKLLCHDLFTAQETGPSLNHTVTESCFKKDISYIDSDTFDVHLGINKKFVHGSLGPAEIANDDAALSLKLLCNDLLNGCGNRSSANFMGNQSSLTTTKHPLAENCVYKISSNRPNNFDVGLTCNSKSVHESVGPAEIENDDALSLKLLCNDLLVDHGTQSDANILKNQPYLAPTRHTIPENCLDKIASNSQHSFDVGLAINRKSVGQGIVESNELVKDGATLSLRRLCNDLLTARETLSDADILKNQPSLASTKHLSSTSDLLMLGPGLVVVRRMI